MSRTGVGCRVLIDGAQLDDGCLDWMNPPDPVVPYGVTAADGLAITWGRSTTVDQPQASTCTFRIVDDPGGATVLETIRLGARVDVYADADIGGTGTSNAFIDPSFDTEVRGTVRNATLVRSQHRAEVPGGWSAGFSAVDSNLAGVVTMPPGPLQTPGTNPLAWILIQSTTGGETWTIRARVFIPPAMNLRMRPVAYTGPYANASSVLPFSATATGDGSGWQTLEIVFAPGLTSVWLGVQFESSGGVTWADAPPAETWADVLTVGTEWGDYSTVWIDRLDVLGPTGANSTTVLAFSGRITDMEGSYSQSEDSPSLSVTATDFLGDLGNRYIGDQPFPMENVEKRTTRILALAATANDPPITVDIAPTLQPIPLSWDDVDHQSASDLLTEIASSVDGVLWSATHPVVGPYVRLEDPSRRIALYQLALIGGLIVIIPVDFEDDPDAPPSVSACDILRDPVTFLTNVSDVATRVSVTWLEQTVDEDGNPATETRRADANNIGAEVVVGTRAVNVSTILTDADDADSVAEQILARLGSSWRIAGVAVTDADVTVPDANAARMLVMLLNGVTRGGQPLILTDLPSWSPTGESAPIYLEGGTYSFVGGGWDLDLTVSRAAGQGHNATWNEIPNSPAWIWNAWNPDITWDALRGVAGPS